MYGIYRIQKGFFNFITNVSTFLKFITITVCYLVN